MRIAPMAGGTLLRMNNFRDVLPNESKDTGRAELYAQTAALAPLSEYNHVAARLSFGFLWAFLRSRRFYPCRHYFCHINLHWLTKP
jgi:hypothetical protein